MSTLVIDELYPGIVWAQPVNISKDIDVAYVRPWVITWGTLASGTFTCRIKDGVTTLKTVTIDYTDINASKSTAYAHGYMRFDLDPMVLRVASTELNTSYTLEFEMVGGVKDTSNFLGIVRQYEARVYASVPEPPSNSMVSPMGLELYKFKESQ